MSELIDIYQDNIKTIFTRIHKILENVNILSEDKAQSAINEAENNLKEAERMVTLNVYINLDQKP
jgi:N-acetylmuramic acid 6-phosphate (MurNAc-6-P) etherase